MILIGQYDSPFVRRVGIALVRYGLAFRHEPWSTFGDADRLRLHNPLTRVPTLVLENGESVIDSHMILDYLDGLMPAGERLFPVAGDARRHALKRASLATGIGDKGASLLYEQRLHDSTSEVWVGRCTRQIADGWATLEQDLAARPDMDGHAEIAIACVWRFLHEVHPGLVDGAAYPRVASLAARLEGTAPFRAIFQPFIPPA